MRKLIPDDVFIEAWKKHKSATKVSRELGLHIRSVYKQRAAIEAKSGQLLKAGAVQPLAAARKLQVHQHNASVYLGIENGTVIVFSDAHFWPGVRTTAYRGLLEVIKMLKPKAVICNGDAFDGASISRHPIGPGVSEWETMPSVLDELKACEISLGEIEDTAKAANRSVRLVWPLGNHDARFSGRLAMAASEFRGVNGFHLKDHFPQWEPCWACWPTEDLVVKHRWKGGIHATHNNTVNAGKSFVTGHLHSLKVTPWTDYTGTRYGVDTGTLSEPYSKQFDYTELNPVNWRAGFAVLTIRDGQLMVPEVVQKWDDNHVEFRGELIKV